MNLLDLPVEILYAIVEETIPESLEHVAVTCQAIYQHCIPFLARHNRLRRQFRSFKYASCNEKPHEERHPHWPLFTNPHPHRSFELLLRIAEEPLVARYIVHADLSQDYICPYRSDFDSSSDDDDPRQVQRRHRKNACEKAILELLQHSSYLLQAGAAWKDGLRAGKRGVVLDLDPETLLSYILAERHHDVNLKCLTDTLLLTLLPNVRSFKLPNTWRLPEPSILYDNRINATWALLDSIVERNVNVSISNTPGSAVALSMLEKLSAHYVPVRAGFHVWPPFVPLAQLNYVRVSRFITQPHTAEILFHPRYINFGSMLQTLELTYSSCHPGTIATILQPCKNLKSFVFSYMHHDHMNGSRFWDPAMLLSTVAESVGLTLEKLSFSTHSCQGGVSSKILDLTGFLNLRELELGICVLLAPISREGELQQRWSAAERLKRTWGGAQAAFNLQQYLPYSGVSLALLVDMMCDCRDNAHARCCGTFLSDVIDKGTGKPKLPQLNSIFVEDAIWGFGRREDNKLRRWQEALSVLSHVRNAEGELLIKTRPREDY